MIARNFPMKLFLLFFAVSCWMVPVRPCHALTRYVTPGGSSGGQGTTLQQPWSLTKAFSSALPGDLVLVQPGIYPGKYEITASGTPPNAGTGAPAVPITYRADAAAGPVVIDGTGVGGANDGLIFIRANNAKPRASDLVIEGFEIRNFLNVNDASGIRILCQGNGSVARIAVRRCYIHDIRGQNAMGITVYGMSSINAITGITLEGCEVANCDPSPSEAVVLNGNVDGFTVKDCVIRDCNNIGLDMIGGEPGFPVAPAAGKVARNGLVQGCLVSNIINAVNISGAGIYVDGGRLITIEHCRVEDSDFGIEVGSENSGVTTDGVVVRNNILRNNRFNALVVGGEGADNGRVDGCRFYHNLLYRNGTQDVFASEIFLQYGTGNLFENNIVYPIADESPSFFYVAVGNAGTSFRNNLWFTEGGNANTDGDFAWQEGVCCGSYAEFRNVTGQDARGTYANPSFLIETTGDYHLDASSPARDAGLANADQASGLLVDLDGLPRVEGSAPDIGPDEVWPVDAWWRTHFPAVTLTAAQLLVDADLDGAPNLLEYAAGSLPESNASLPGFGPLTVPGSRGFVFQKATAAVDVDLRLFTSGNLSVWTLSDLSPLPGPISGSRQAQTWTLPPPAAPKIFLHLEAKLKP